MLSKTQKQRALSAVSVSDLSSSQKRHLVSKITSPSATPKSVSGLLVAVGLGAVGAGIFGAGKVGNEYLGKIGSDDSDIDFDESLGSSDLVGHQRLPNPPDSDRTNDGPAHDPNNTDQRFDRHGRPLFDANGDPYLIDSSRDRVVDTDGDGSPDGMHGVVDSNTDSGLLGGLGLGDLISALANRFLDFELTGGEREANAFTAEQNRLANEFSAQQAEISRDWQEQMYDKYNSLQGKIAQADQAGVNPMFALGSGVTPTGFTSSSPSGHAGSSVGASPALNGQLPALLQSFLGIAKVKSDIDKTKAETSQIIADTNVSLQKLPYEIEKLQSSTGLDKSSSDLNLQKIIESATSVEKIKVDMNLSQKQAELFSEQISYLSAQASYINSIKDHDVALKKAQSLIATWQEENKELFKGLEVGADVVGVLTQLGLGIFNAKTGRIIANNGLPVQQPLQLPTPN